MDNSTIRNALVLGAGGVSPVILSLIKSGVQNISIANRTVEKCIFKRNLKI